MSQNVLTLCSVLGLLCNSGPAPDVAVIQTAYEQEASDTNTAHDKGLKVIQAKCDDGKEGRFLCQVTFMSKQDPTERLYFDVVSVVRTPKGWELKTGLCKR